MARKALIAVLVYETSITNLSKKKRKKTANKDHNTANTKVCFKSFVT